MATIGNLLNADQRQLDQNQTNPFSVLADIVYKRAEEQRIAEVDRQNRMKNLMDMAKTAEYLNSSKGIDKAGYMANNAGKYQWEVEGLDNDGKPKMKLVNTEADIPQLQNSLAELGVNPFNEDGTPKNRTMILSEKAKRQAELQKTKDDIARERINDTSPSLEQYKWKKMDELFQMNEYNKVKRTEIEAARDSASRITPGILGSIQRAGMKLTDPNNPAFTDWQNIKIVLTDAQLLNTAKTKGAISDKEMLLFQKAAANDDIASLSAMKPVFDRLINFLNAEEKSKKDFFKKTFKEDPDQWFGAASNSDVAQGGSVPEVGGSFNGEKVINVKRIR